ncbi:hypothetical protein GCM10011415_28090 [Salipiger pallidus]|uniref:Uncharacterized protein n=1 Tax=Salipiger pallidus TaxID=1775170 RepID=A0A8J3EH41_9RHOB|nr:DUF6441 family protein [Salipiger pallidus]GGG77563.1 hypothetical protein GCM10011415_28090 [Salipiger pallidus]
MSRTRLEAALEGNLEQYMREELDLAERAVTRGVHGRATALKHALRADVIAGGLGRRLSKSWRHESYPRNGASLGAASLVFTKAEKLIRAFDEGSDVKSSEGFFLAIPTPSAPKLGVGRKRISPSTFPEHRFGRLRFVYVKGGTSLLVVDNQRATKKGGYALSKSKRALASGTGLHTVPMFWLVPRARLRKRLNVERVERAALSGLAGDIDREFQTLSRRRLR